MHMNLLPLEEIKCNKSTQTHTDGKDSKVTLRFPKYDTWRKTFLF